MSDGALKFTWSRFFWTASVELPSWKGRQYADRGKSETSHGFVEIVFAPERRDEAPLSEEELSTVSWFIDHEAAISAALLESVLVEYPAMSESYGFDEDELREYMPPADSIEDLRALIHLDHVNVHPLAKDGMPYIGFEFACSWDPEHGLGVLMNGERTVKIGGADTAILLWIAERDSKR